MDDALRARLVAAARRGEILYYGDLAPALGLHLDNPQHRRRIGEILGDISIHELKAGRPMLSSIVVQRDDGLPGVGFFHLGEELGVVLEGEDAVAFAVRQLKATFAYWVAAPADVG